VTGVARARYRDALRHRDLRLLIATFLVDQVGSWSYIVVISVYIFDRTHSTQWLAANAACRWAPSLLVASYGGVLADRYQRTTVMMVSALASAILMAGMAAVVATGAPVAFVLAISAVASVALAPYQPAAGALTPEIVGEKGPGRRELHLLGPAEPGGGNRAALQVSQPSPALLSVAGTRMARTPWLRPPESQPRSQERRPMTPDERGGSRP
jgi:MFS family permease